jgi:hypothetical protein
MKLKAIIAAGLSALALSGVMASGAAAEVPLSPSAEEMAAHPGQGYAVTCEMSSFESRETQFTDQYVNKANAEGKCTARWFDDAAVTPTQPSSSARKAAQKRKHHKHHRARHHR